METIAGQHIEQILMAAELSIRSPYARPGGAIRGACWGKKRIFAVANIKLNKLAKRFRLHKPKTRGRPHHDRRQRIPHPGATAALPRGQSEEFAVECDGETICFSRSVEIHEKVIGAFIEKYMFY